MGWRVGVDTGGTFTDVIGWNVERGVVSLGKVWTRPDPAETVEAALGALGIVEDQVSSITYGTTLVTNALVENQFPDTCLVTNEGFGDLLRIARQNRDIIYSFSRPTREQPIVPRERCHEVPGRLSFEGEELEPLALDKVEDLASRLNGKTSAIAVCLLHAYADPTHERRVGEVLRRVAKHVSLSSDISGESREYERALVTVLNASLLPIVDRFRAGLRKPLPRAKIDLFHSAGGMIGLDSAARLPISLSLSGPAAGVEAAGRVARDIELPTAVSFDMGGTTTDVCLLTEARPEITSQSRVGRWPVRQPMVAVDTIGAGGGSLVRYEDGRLSVGPDSAGSSPGPVCYGKGGTIPTLTDAAAVLGYLDGASRLSTGLTIDRAAAERAIAGVAARIGCSSIELALGIIDVANAEAARALRKVTVDRGVNIRDCTMIAFGGAGPMFACGIARSLGMRRVVVPGASSCLSALGCLLADRSFTIQRTVNIHRDAFSREALAKIAGDIETSLSAELATDEPVEFKYTALMHYVGQSFPIEIVFTGPTDRDALDHAFRRKHEALYKFASDDPWELEAIRIEGTVKGTQGAFPGIAAVAPESSRLGAVTAYFAQQPGEVELLHRDGLEEGRPVNGPAIIVDKFSTIVVPPGAIVRVGPNKHLDIEISEQ